MTELVKVGSTVAARRGFLTTPAIVERIDGLTYRQLDYWQRAGYVHPTNGAEPGSGYARIWAEDEVAVIDRMVRLLSVGFLLGVAHEVARLGVGAHYIGAGVTVEVADEVTP